MFLANFAQISKNTNNIIFFLFRIKLFIGLILDFLVTYEVLIRKCMPHYRNWTVLRESEAGWYGRAGYNFLIKSCQLIFDGFAYVVMHYHALEIVFRSFVISISVSYCSTRGKSGTTDFLVVIFQQFSSLTLASLKIWIRSGLLRSTLWLMAIVWSHSSLTWSFSKILYEIYLQSGWQFETKSLSQPELWRLQFSVLLTILNADVMCWKVFIS